MNGPIAQIVALALHGNAAISGAPSADFLATNSTAQFCQSIDFVREETAWFGLGKDRVGMSSPGEWFDDLKKRGATQIGVRWTAGKDSAPDRMLAAFVGGGGAWTLQVKLSDGIHELWASRWAVDESRRNIDGKIWRVRYERVYAGRESLNVADLPAARSELRQALEDVRVFASRKDTQPFTAMFEKALSALEAKPGSSAYHQDLYPKDAGSLAGAHVLQAAQHAWVFGGMGSWNDLGFEGADGKEYDRVSERLYGALVHAIPAAVEER